MKRYNKGEWSEFYAAIKILNDKQIPIVNRKLEPTGADIKVSQLLLKSIYSQDRVTYDISGDKIALVMDGQSIKNLFLDKDDVAMLFNEITDGEGRSFSVPIAEKIMSSLDLESIKANAATKADLEAVASLSNNEGMKSTFEKIGFSIKSQVGKSPTLLNTSKSTNFVFEVKDFHGDKNTINNIGTRSKIMDRLEAIERRGGELKYKGMANSIFEKNLRLIDLNMPEIVAQMLYIFYTTRGKNKLSDIVPQIINNLSFEITLEELEHKVKRFISDIALGMMPATPWGGNSVNGGCIVVKKTGDLACLILSSKAEFDNFLYDNVSFDTPSSSAYNFGSLYDGANGLCFNLNIQLRMFK